MAKSANDAGWVQHKEPRPFLYLDPRPVPSSSSESPREGVDELAHRVLDEVPALVRALVNHTIAQQNRDSLRSGRAQPIPISVLNRRRRSARAWIVAILGGRTDRATLHALTHTWIPQLAGTGPEIRQSARTGYLCMEFLRGAITANIFGGPANNLVPAAKALYALDNVLGVHLQALREVVHQDFTGASPRQYAH